MAERGKVFNNISATTDPFDLKNGLYAMTAVASFGGGTVKLQKRAQDQTTFVDVLSFSANGYDTASLMDGIYKVTIATASAVYVRIATVQTGDVN